MLIFNCHNIAQTQINDAETDMDENSPFLQHFRYSGQQGQQQQKSNIKITISTGISMPSDSPSISGRLPFVVVGSVIWKYYDITTLSDIMLTNINNTNAISWRQQTLRVSITHTTTIPLCEGLHPLGRKHQRAQIGSCSQASLHQLQVWVRGCVWTP